MNETNVYIPEHRLVVMPARKVACSSIKEALKAAYPRQKMQIVDNPQVAEIKAEHPRTQIIGWVRHPLDRLVSFHAHLILRKGRDDTGWYSALDKFGFYRDMLFPEMVRVIAGVSDDDADPHFRSQTALMCHGGDFLPTWVGRFENLIADWHEFRAMVPFPLEDLPHKNASPRGAWAGYYDKDTERIARERFAADIIRWYRS